MTTSSPQRDRHPRTQQHPHVLEAPSQLACLVCGHHALSPTHPAEARGPAPDRWFCLTCGAHRVLP